MKVADVPPNDVQILIADDPELLHRIYQLRYVVSVGELKKNVPSANHIKNIIFDEEIDNHCSTIICGLTPTGDLVASLRLTWGEFGTPTGYHEQFLLDKFSEFSNNHFSFSSRLIINPQWRDGSLLLRLFTYAYRLVRQKGCYFNFLNCRPGSISKLYESFGFRQYGETYLDSHLGPQVRLVLVTEDIQHLSKISSVLEPIAHTMVNSPKFSTVFQRLFPTTVNINEET